MVNQLVSSPLFGIMLCVVTFWVGTRVNQWLRTPVANPLLIAILLCSVVLLAFRIPLEQFNIGGEIINMLVGPATAALALSIYHQRKVLGKYFLPIVVGSFAGAATSLASVALLCRLFRLDEVILSSLLPKSVTTAIALEISAGRGGIGSVTILAVLITGVSGAVFAPLMIRLFRVKNPVAQGVAIGTCSHAVGTSKAIELGELQGAMSGIAIGVAGLMTVLITLLF